MLKGHITSTILQTSNHFQLCFSKLLAWKIKPKNIISSINNIGHSTNKREITIISIILHIRLDSEFTTHHSQSRIDGATIQKSNNTVTHLAPWDFAQMHSLVKELQLNPFHIEKLLMQILPGPFGLGRTKLLLVLRSHGVKARC